MQSAHLNSSPNIETYIQSKIELQQKILDYLDSSEENDDAYISFTQVINDIIVQNNTNDLLEFLHFLNIISNHHRRHILFIKKVEEILTLLKKSIKQSFSETTIFNIFKNNKKILLFLFDSQIISPNKIFIKKLLNKKYKKMNYNSYFYPEIEKEAKIDTNGENFEINRKNGENESFICQLIRNDLVEEFISYVNKTNYSLKSTIQESIFETNFFLIDKTPTLIEYAAFFGSIQIFQYLQLNNVEIKSSIWLYAIHGNHPEMIHLLEYSDIKPENDDYRKCFKEAIKCHHNDIANYLYNNFLNNEYIKKRKTKKNYEGEINDQHEIICNDFSHLILKYFNFEYFNEIDFNNNSFKYAIYDLCRYDYPLFLETIIQAKKGELNLNYNFIFTKKTKDVKEKNFYRKYYNYNYEEIYSTLLCAATKNENLYIVKILLNRPEINVNRNLLKCFWTQETLNDYDINEKSILWLKNNSNIDDNNRYEYFKSDTPLNISIKNQNYEIVETLLSHPNIDIFIKSITRKWNFCDNGDTEKISEKEDTPLMISIKKDDFDIINLLLSNENVNINEKSISKNGTINSKKYDHVKVFIKESELTALSFSIENNKLELVKLLLSKPPINVHCKIIDKYISFKSEKPISILTFRLHNWQFDSKAFKKISEINNENLSGEFEVVKEVFHIAVNKGNTQIIRLLLERPEINENINIIYKNDDVIKIETTLHIAAQYGNFEIFKLLFSKFNIDINYKSMDLINCIDPEEKTLLHFAVQNNHLEIVKLLLSSHQGININEFTNMGKTALYFAVVLKNYSECDKLKFTEEKQNSRALEILKLLVSNPLIDVNVKTCDKISKDIYSEKTALYIAAKYKRIQQFLILLSHPEIDVNSPFLKLEDNKIIKRKTVLYKVIKNKNLEMTRHLLSHPDIDVNDKSYSKTEKKLKEIAPLHAAVLTNNSNIIRLLTSHPKIDINNRYILNYDNSFNYKFHDEFKFTRLEFIDGCVKQEHGTALHLAISNLYDCYDIVQSLLSNKNIDINEEMYQITSTEKVYGITILHLAILKRNKKIIRLLLSNSKINVNKKIKITKTIIIEKPKNRYTAIKNYYYMFAIREHIIMSDMLYNGAIKFIYLNDEDMTEIHDMTPLHLALDIPDLDIIKLLLKNPNIDVNETMLMKLKNGNKLGITALHMAIKMESLEIIKILLKHQNININAPFEINRMSDTYKISPLHYAAIKNNKEITDKLFLAGADYL